MEGQLEDIAQITGEMNYTDVGKIMTAVETDNALREQVRALISDWEDAAEKENEGEMTRIAKELKKLVPAESKTEAENTHLVDLGLDPKFKDMIDSVFGQMSDGYWENTPRMRGYWKFARPILKDNKIYLEIDNAHWKGDGGRSVYNLWDGMSDARVKQFLADKIKFLVKEEGLKWDRGNTNTTDYLSYSNPYPVKDCYYAYELLKGRNVGKHPEYSESYVGIKDGKEFPVNVEYIEVEDDWQGNTSPDIYRVTVNGESGETDATEEEKACVGKVLRALGYSLKESKKSEGGSDGWDGWENVEGLEETLDSVEALTYELRSLVRGARTRCKTWSELSDYVKRLADDLSVAGENIGYMDDDSDESKKKGHSNGEN